MSTKILWLSDNLYEGFAPDKADQDFIFANMLEFAQTIARPDTEFVVNVLTESMMSHSVPVGISRPGPLATYRYNEALMAVELLERVKQAEDDGFDAAFAGMCYGEFFLQGARQAVSMPVVGPAESAMTVAQLMGERFAVVTVAPRYIPSMENHIRIRGWQDKAIKNRPVRAWEPAFTQLMLDAYSGRPEQMIEEFQRVALECIKDGADVIICGCNPMGAAFAQLGFNEIPGTGVPVVTALPAMIKLAESLVDLRRSLGLTKSESMNSPYRSTPDYVLQDFAARGFGMPQVRKRGLADAQRYAPVKDLART